MTSSRYSTNISIYRILKALQGKAIPSDTQDIPPVLLPENESLSELAELMEGSLPGETATLPSGFTVSYGSLPLASVEEANEGTSNEVVLTPASHSWAHEYGGIYITTGSVSQSFTANTWAKLTGTFQNYMEDSGGEINCDWNDDRIIINEVGTYFIAYNISLYTDGAAGSFVDAATSVSGTVSVSNRARSSWHTSGSYVSLSGGAHIDIPTSGYYVDLRLRTSANLTVRADTGQLMVTKMVG